jgi:hypothetical protein
MIHTLYKTTNLKNNRFYVGVHSTEDEKFGTEEWKDPYVGSGNAIWNALKKYGREIFVVEILGYYPDANSAYQAEGELVTKEWLEENKKAYNITPGGGRPPVSTNTKWINNGKINKRVANNAPIEGWFIGRLFRFSDEEIEKRTARIMELNLNNNPMKNPESKAKMIKTICDQYVNGRKSKNQYTKGK